VHLDGRKVHLVYARYTSPSACFSFTFSSKVDLVDLVWNPEQINGLHDVVSRDHENIEELAADTPRYTSRGAGEHIPLQ